jgi:phage pi2 protein 07
MMLAPNEVLVKARVYLGEVIPEFAALEPKVEEMVLAHDSSTWNITFYARSKNISKPETVADMLSNPRIEKVVSVAANDGALIAVRNPAQF